MVCQSNAPSHLDCSNFFFLLETILHWSSLYYILIHICKCLCRRVIYKRNYYVKSMTVLKSDQTSKIALQKWWANFIPNKMYRMWPHPQTLLTLNITHLWKNFQFDRGKFLFQHAFPWWLVMLGKIYIIKLWDLNK